MNLYMRNNHRDHYGSSYLTGSMVKLQWACPHVNLSLPCQHMMAQLYSGLCFYVIRNSSEHDNEQGHFAEATARHVETHILHKKLSWKEHEPSLNEWTPFRIGIICSQKYYTNAKALRTNKRCFRKEGYIMLTPRLTSYTTRSSDTNPSEKNLYL